MPLLLERVGRKLLKYGDELLWHVIGRRIRGYRRYELNGYSIYLDVSESADMFKRARGHYEPVKQRFLRAFLRPGMTFVDVGANRGDFTLLAASLVGSGGRVYAIEPEAENCRWLQRSIHENHFTNIELIQAAATDQVGEAKLYLGQRSGWHTLLPGYNPPEHGAVMVRTMKLDDALGHIPRLDLMKIDVEGFEGPVVRGALALIKRMKPVVLMDTHPQMGAELGSIEQSFQSLGYRLSRIDDPTTLLDHLPRREMDVLCSP